MNTLARTLIDSALDLASKLKGVDSALTVAAITIAERQAAMVRAAKFPHLEPEHRPRIHDDGSIADAYLIQDLAMLREMCQEQGFLSI